jgi:hypothetical protein
MAGTAWAGKARAADFVSRAAGGVLCYNRLLALV